MAKRGYTPEQVISKLREDEVLLSQGNTIAVVSKRIGVTEQTDYQWRKEYGGMRVEQVLKLKEIGYVRTGQDRDYQTLPGILTFDKGTTTKYTLLCIL